jgi:hypothetical protein
MHVRGIRLYVAPSGWDLHYAVGPLCGQIRCSSKEKRKPRPLQNQMELRPRQTERGPNG